VSNFCYSSNLGKERKIFALAPLLYARRESFAVCLRREPGAFGDPFFFGSDSLLATLYDRTWRRKRMLVWIISFNFLTMILALLIGVAIIAYPLS
jgi:hypothetical protein